MRISLKLAAIGLAALAATTACVVHGLSPYPAAAVMAGTAVAASGVNRARTGDCWASCGAHRMCDRDSGMCVMQPCGGECRYDEICVHEQCVQRRTEQAKRADLDGGEASDDDGGEPGP